MRIHVNFPRFCTSLLTAPVTVASSAVMQLHLNIYVHTYLHIHTYINIYIYVCLHVLTYALNSKKHFADKNRKNFHLNVSQCMRQESVACACGICIHVVCIYSHICKPMEHFHIFVKSKKKILRFLATIGRILSLCVSSQRGQIGDSEKKRIKNIY